MVTCLAKCLRGHGGPRWSWIVMLGLCWLFAASALAQPRPGPKDWTLPVGWAIQSPPAGKPAIEFEIAQPSADRNGVMPFQPRWIPTYQRLKVVVDKVDPVPLADRKDPVKLSAASKAKAEAHANAIATALGDMSRVKVEMGPKVQIVTGSVPNPNFDRRFRVSPLNPLWLATYAEVQTWQVVTTNISAVHPKVNHTGEVGDQLRFGPGTLPGGGSGSPGSSMGSMKGLGLGASGLDIFGEPSVVVFGTDLFESVIFPEQGQSDTSIMLDVLEDLRLHGISADFDGDENLLRLLVPIADGVGLHFGWTDTALQFEFALVDTDLLVPLPAVVWLLLGGLPLLLVERRTRAARGR